MFFGSLHSRIVFFFTILLMVVQIIAFLLINATSLEIAKKQNIDELTSGNRIFQQLLAQNQQRLIEAASLLSADFGFRKAVASNDTGTILSALNNHGSRIQADMMMLASLNNTLLADTLHPLTTPMAASPLTALVHAAEKAGDASAFLWIEQKVYQVVLVPVLAPDPIAWLAMGFWVNNHLARQLQEVTNLHVSFLSKSSGNRWTLLASTQPPAASSNLLKIAVQNNVSNHPISEAITVDDYATLFSALQQADDFSVFTVLQRSVTEATQPIRQLRMTLLELGLASLGLSSLGGMFLAKKLTYPIKMLAEVVDKIRQGDFSQTTQLHYAEQAQNSVGNNVSTQEVDILRQAYIEILRLAHQDVLTGLPNRALFNDRLNYMVSLANRTDLRFSVLMIDLNRFKFINDTLGHHAGDEVIRLVGKRLRSALRESDTIARLGGDEFAVLLSTGDQNAISTVTKNIAQQIEKPMEIEGQQLDVGCSIGIAFFPQHGEDSTTLLRHADSAMYVAKRGKTGAAIYDPLQDNNEDQHLSLLSELRNALDDNEFELYYQPQINLLTERVIGAEALIRWHHPQRGLVPPIDFIPFAESSGIIRLITQWVIKAAIQQCGVWLSQGMSIKLSINISAQDLANSKLPGLVALSLQENQVSAQMVCLEITESALIKNPEGALATLAQLRKLGITIAIDDYGTGYSSLAYVKNLPVTELKIDRTFINDIVNCSENNAIVRYTIALAHDLGLKVVAEGIECEEELNLLQKLGCDYAQGYLISKPISATQLYLWLNNLTLETPLQLNK